MFAFIGVIVILGVVFGIYEAFIGGERDLELLFLAAVMMPIFIVLLINNLVLVRYIKKVKHGQFKVRHVEITDKEPGNYGGISFCATVRPVEGSDTAVIEIERGLYDKLRTGSVGRFVRIDDEKVRRLCSPYWFVADSDYAVSPGAGDSAGNLKVFSEPSDDVHQELYTWFVNENKGAFARTAICLFLFLVGGISIGIGSFAEDLSRYTVLMFVLGGMFICAIPMIMISVDHTRMIYSGRSGAMTIWALWIVMNLFGSTVVYMSPLPAALRLLILIVMFLLNAASIFFAQRDLYYTLKELKSRRYTVSPVTVVTLETDRTKQFMIYGYCEYVLVAKDASDQTFEVKVTKKMFKSTFSGAAGLLAVLDKKPAVRIFKGREL